jgi:hypothetical protein
MRMLRFSFLAVGWREEVIGSATLFSFVVARVERDRNRRKV